MKGDRFVLLALILLPFENKANSVLSDITETKNA